MCGCAVVVSSVCVHRCTVSSLAHDHSAHFVGGEHRSSSSSDQLPDDHTDDHKDDHAADVVVHSSLASTSHQLPDDHTDDHAADVVGHSSSTDTSHQLPDDHAAHVVGHSSSASTSHQLPDDHTSDAVGVDQSSSCPNVKITVATANNCNGKRKWDKYNYCVFCMKQFPKLPDHFARKHFNETDVVQVFSYPKNSRHRQTLMMKLTNKIVKLYAWCSIP